MANYTINNLPNTVSSISDSDILPVWDSANEQTAKVTRANLLGVSKNEVIVSSSTTLTGATLETNSVIRVMFTSAITGSDTTTALSLSYNGTAYSVMVGKQGSLSNFVASYVDSTYTYLQAYTTLELAFDGTQFIIIGNPVVLSSSDYTIYADGTKIDTTFINNVDITSDVTFQDYIDDTASIISVFRYGQLIILNLTLELNSGTGLTWYNIGSLPSAYIPTSTIDVRASVTSINGYTYSFAINNAGYMYLVSSINPLIDGDVIRFQIAYLIPN